MNIKDSINKTKMEFETSFLDEEYYNLQKQDGTHLNLILGNLKLQKNAKF